MPVSYNFFDKYILIYFIFRKAHNVNPSHRVAIFGIGTGISVLRKHLFSNHIDEWVTACDQAQIKITASAAAEAVRQFRKEPASTQSESEQPPYSKEAFIDAIVDFVVGDDLVSVKFYFIIKYLMSTQPLNIIQSPRLRKIFLLLRQELKESDIPGRTTIRNRVEKAYQDYMQQLEKDIAVCNSIFLNF